jgi:glycosyltransferase involved in cell wall biosynthesis
MPLVSIILPARDAAATLGTALQSLRAQTFQDWELLVVDDGSVDATAGIARDVAGADHRIQLLRQPAGGIVSALDAGIRAAGGSMIARMDADDVAHPERLAEQVRYLESRPDLGVVGCRVEFGGDQQAQAGYAVHVDWLNGLVTPEQIRLNRFVESPFAHPSVLFRRELIAQHGGYRQGEFPEDYELWLRWLEAGVPMAKVPRVLLTWNDSPARLSRTDRRYAPEAFYRVKADYLARAVRHTQRGRSVWIWGAGRPTRRRAEWLTHHGIEIAGYIDIDPAKAGRRIHGCPVVSPLDLPRPEAAMVLGYVGTRGARELIHPQLVRRGFVEGDDFWMAA